MMPLSNLLRLPASGGAFYYDLFYLLALLAVYIGLVWTGFRQKFNLLSWFLLLAITWFSFLFGTKIFTYSPAEWQLLLRAGILSPTTGKTLLGGLAFCLITFLLLRRAFPFTNRHLDAFALVIPLGIALQRPGCLLYGCCYGNLTSLPWGIQYGPGTLAHYHQFEAGLIHAQSAASLPVHPYPLYEAGAALMIAGLLVWLKPRVRQAGNFFLLSLLLYSLFRFFLEFFRFPLALTAADNLYWGMKSTQWLLLMGILLLGILFLYREKKQPAKVQISRPILPFTASLWILALVMAGWMLRHWFTYTELLALNLALLPALTWAAYRGIGAAFAPASPWFGLVALMLPLLLMSQTLPDSTGNKVPDAAQTKEYHTLRLGFGFGNYQNAHTIGYGSGCDQVANTTYYQQQYTVGGAGYAITQKGQKYSITYGLNGYLGSHREEEINRNDTPVINGKKVKTTLLGINPYLRYDRKWFGLGAGIHAGSLVYTLNNHFEEGAGQPQSASNKTPIYPQLYFRAGPTRILFAEFRLADQVPSGLPGLRSQVSLGSGFGLRNGTFFRFGTNGLEQLASVHLVTSDKLVLEPLLLWGTSQTPDRVRQRQVMLGLHYRFQKP